MRYGNIIFVIHETIKNAGNFRNYLIDNTEYLITFHFPHGYLPKPSYIEIYKDGKFSSRKEFPRIKINSSILKLISYYLYLNYTILRFGRPKSFVIVENPVFCIFNGFTGIIKKTKFVFWVGDYFPSHTGFMRFYNKVADFYIKTLRYIIYVSPPLQDLYSDKVHMETKDKFRSQISLGMEKKLWNKKKLLKSKKITVGFIGVLRKQQGLELVFKYLKKTNNVSFEIIGDGYSLDYYKKMVRRQGINDKVIFYGFVDDPLPIVEKWNIGVALYENSDKNVSKYCEPVKIKNYLEEGVVFYNTKLLTFGIIYL